MYVAFIHTDTHTHRHMFFSWDKISNNNSWTQSNSMPRVEDTNIKPSWFAGWWPNLNRVNLMLVNQVLHIIWIFWGQHIALSILQYSRFIQAIIYVRMSFCFWLYYTAYFAYRFISQWIPELLSCSNHCEYNNYTLYRKYVTIPCGHRGINIKPLLSII